MNAETRFKCLVCKELHKHINNARACCPPRVRTVYVCANCDEDYASAVDAGQCCRTELSKPYKSKT